MDIDGGEITQNFFLTIPTVDYSSEHLVGDSDNVHEAEPSDIYLPHMTLSLLMKDTTFAMESFARKLARLARLAHQS